MNRILSLLLFLLACREIHEPDAAPGPDARLTGPDARPGLDAAPGSDGTPTRQPCTGNFGTGLTASYGRLDGYLVSVVMPGGSRSCNGDKDHVHLQVLMHAAVYDVAINVNDTESTIGVAFLERDLALDGAWSEGWHTDARLDYAEIGLSASEFTPTGQAPLALQIEQELQDVNHISVFMTGYGPDGGHLVHRNAFEADGAVLIHPLAPAPHALFFHFASQQF